MILFYELLYYNAEGYSHPAFHNPGRIQFNNRDPLDVFHEFFYDDFYVEWDGFDNFSERKNSIFEQSMASHFKCFHSYPFCPQHHKLHPNQ